MLHYVVVYVVNYEMQTVVWHTADRVFGGGGRWEWMNMQSIRNFGYLFYSRTEHTDEWMNHEIVIDWWRRRVRSCTHNVFFVMQFNICWLKFSFGMCVELYFSYWEILLTQTFVSEFTFTVKMELPKSFFGFRFFFCKSIIYTKRAHNWILNSWKHIFRLRFL